MFFIQLLLFVVLIITLIGFVYYSLQSKKEEFHTSPWFKYRSLMNIHMGGCFLALATIQLTLTSTNGLRFVLIGLIYFVGVVNMYYGFKRWRSMSTS